MTLQKRIFSKLSEYSKKQLSKRNIKLSTIDDIQKLYEESVNLENEVLNNREEVNSQARKINEEIVSFIDMYNNADTDAQRIYYNSAKIDELITDLNDKAEVLGFLPEEVISNYTEIIDFIGNYETGSFFGFLNEEAKDLLDNNL